MVNDNNSRQRRHRDNSSFGERQGRRYRDAPRESGSDIPRRGDRTNTSGNSLQSPGTERRGQQRATRRSTNESRFSNRHRGGRNDRPFRSNHHDTTPRPTRGGTAKTNEPAIPKDITPQDLEPAIRRDLRGLNKENADLVCRHLVAATWALEDNPQLALRHGRAAKARAGRIAVVREMLGILAYNAGEWSETLSELRAARRIGGGPGLLALMADAERGLGRPERAIEIARSEEAAQLDDDDTIELKIVEAGARMDLGQVDAALVTLRDAGLSDSGTGERAARLAYAYANILDAAERPDEARTWFQVARDAEPDATDAAERLASLEKDSTT